MDTRVDLGSVSISHVADTDDIEGIALPERRVTDTWSHAQQREWLVWCVALLLRTRVASQGDRHTSRDTYTYVYIHATTHMYIYLHILLVPFVVLRWNCSVGYSFIESFTRAVFMHSLNHSLVLTLVTLCFRFIRVCMSVLLFTLS